MSRPPAPPRERRRRIPDEQRAYRPAALFQPRPAHAPPPTLAPPVTISLPLLLLSDDEIRMYTERTGRFVASVEAHSMLSPDALGYNLLLPRDYNPDNPAHAVVPQRCIQHWLECRVGDAYLNETEYQLAVERAIKRLGWLDPEFVEAPVVEVSYEAQEREALRQQRAGASLEEIGDHLGFSPPMVQKMIAKAEEAELTQRAHELWEAMAEAMRYDCVPAAVIVEIGKMKPTSKAQLIAAIHDHSLVSRYGVRLSFFNTQALFGWLGLPPPTKPLQYASTLTLHDVNIGLRNLKDAGFAVPGPRKSR